jgi:hypothetical protein
MLSAESMPTSSSTPLPMYPGIMSNAGMSPIRNSPRIAAVRRATGLKGGDPIRVILTVAGAPPEVKVPADFAAALAADERASAFFGKLSNSMQRYHVDNINAANAPETRQRRIGKAIAVFHDGKQR